MSWASVYGKRMLRLADFLETVPPEHFDMTQWKCGTTACAMGWACEIPEFRELGLCLEQSDYSVIFGDYEGFSAAAEFFDITQEEAEELFYNQHENPELLETPKEVAARLRVFVEERRNG